jgi:hypothetical protein
MRLDEPVRKDLWRFLPGDDKMVTSTFRTLVRRVDGDEFSRVRRRNEIEGEIGQ